MTPVTTRVVTVGGWSAAAALVAHGGPALLVDPRWLAVALAGSLAAASGLAVTGGRALERHAQLARLARGELAPATASGFARAPMSLLLGAMLACQGAAHLALLAGGVHTAAEPGGALALHGALAGLGALVLYRLEVLLERVSDRLTAAVSRAIQLLTEAAARPQPTAVPAPASAGPSGHVRLRGPPPVR
jgi:hypothetical protein